MELSLLDWALLYAKIGWHVFPVWGITKGMCDCGGKQNCTPGKHPIYPGGHNGGTTDMEKIKNWWEKHANANIGMNCLKSGVVVVDIDPRNGGDVSFQRLIEEHGFPLSGRVSKTGGGGHHYFYRSPPAPWKAQKYEGIDIQNNAFVILPPSNHSSGGQYEWMVA